MAATPGLQHKYIFGLRSDIKDSITYLDELNVAYLAGSQLVVYNLETKTQRYLNITENGKCQISCISYSGNKKLLAVGIKGERVAVNIYDLTTLKKKKTISRPDESIKEFVALSFSNDTKYLVSVTSHPDWNIHYWSWEKGKLMAYTKGVTHPSGTITNIQFNPNDASQISVIGNMTLRLFRYNEGSLKAMNIRTESKNYLSQAWTADEKLLAGSDDSKILFVEISENKVELNITHSNPPVQTPVHSITTFSKGFACGGAAGTVMFYEKNDDVKEPFKKVKDFIIPEEPAKVNQIYFNPSEESVMCALDSSHMYLLNYGSVEAMKSEEIRFEPVAQPFHRGTITGMDICVRKPLMVTCGTDRCVRVWDYQENTCELSKNFNDDLFSVALHPSGLYVLVGFGDKLRLMNLMVDDIRLFREFNIRNCKECRFSNGGQYFAAVHGNVVQVFNTWTFENVANFMGHEGRVRSISWVHDDTRVITCGSDGAVYEWSMRTLKREGECVLKTCQYTSAIPSPDGKTIFAVGNDRTIKEINEQQISYDPQLDSSGVQITVCHQDKVLFVGLDNGTILSMKYPLDPEHLRWNEIQAHSSNITRMMTSPDDQYVFSAGEDGSIFVLKTTDLALRITRRDHESFASDEVLITRSDVESKITATKELRARIEELKLENEYQLRMKDMAFQDRINEVNSKYTAELDAVRQQNQQLQNQKENERVRHINDIASENERFEKDMGELESMHDTKLATEYEKFRQLEARAAETKNQWTNQLQELDMSREKALRDLTLQYEAKLAERQGEVDRFQEEIKKRLKEFEESAREDEYDADQEISEIKFRYEKKLQEERDIGLRLKGENGLMKKKFNSIQAEIELQKNEVQKLKTEERKLQNIIKALEKDIAGLKKEISERDETIQDKEKRIYDLKKKNQELDKFKFVLDYKIKELKHQIEPRENEIQSMMKQIDAMDTELEIYHQNNNKLELNFSELKQKLKAAEKEVERERSKVLDGSVVVKRFKVDLNACIQHLHEPRVLKAHLRALFQRYCKDNTNVSGEQGDFQREYTRQRAYLERSVVTLREKLAKDQLSQRVENGRMIQENMVLIKEINALRKSLKTKSTGYNLTKDRHPTPVAVVADVMEQQQQPQPDQQPSDRQPSDPLPPTQPSPVPTPLPQQ